MGRSHDRKEQCLESLREKKAKSRADFSINYAGHAFTDWTRGVVSTKTCLREKDTGGGLVRLGEKTPVRCHTRCGYERGGRRGKSDRTMSPHSTGRTNLQKGKIGVG